MKKTISFITLIFLILAPNLTFAETEVKPLSDIEVIKKIFTNLEKGIGNFNEIKLEEKINIKNFTETELENQEIRIKNHPFTLFLIKFSQNKFQVSLDKVGSAEALISDLEISKNKNPKSLPQTQKIFKLSLEQYQKIQETKRQRELQDAIKTFENIK